MDESSSTGPPTEMASGAGALGGAATTQPGDTKGSDVSSSQPEPSHPASSPMSCDKEPAAAGAQKGGEQVATRHLLPTPQGERADAGGSSSSSSSREGVQPLCLDFSSPGGRPLHQRRKMHGIPSKTEGSGSSQEGGHSTQPPSLSSFGGSEGSTSSNVISQAASEDPKKPGTFAKVGNSFQDKRPNTYNAPSEVVSNPFRKGSMLPSGRGGHSSLSSAASRSAGTSSLRDSSGSKGVSKSTVSNAGNTIMADKSPLRLRDSSGSKAVSKSTVSNAGNTIMADKGPLRLRDSSGSKAVSKSTSSQSTARNKPPKPLHQSKESGVGPASASLRASQGPAPFRKVTFSAEGKEPCKDKMVFGVMESLVSSGSDEEEAVALLRKLQNAPKKDGYLHVTYSMGSEDSPSVSWIAKNLSSLQHMPDHIRHLLSKGEWISLVFAKDTPAQILLQLTQEEKYIPLRTHLKLYCKSKQDVLAEMVEGGFASEREAADWILRNLLGDGIVDPAAPALLQKMCGQFNDMARAFAAEDCNKWARDMCISQPALKASVTNQDKRVMAVVLESKQRECLEVLFRCIEEKCNPRDEFVLLAGSGGVMFRDNWSGQKSMKEGLIRYTQREIVKKCKVDLLLSREDFTSCASDCGDSARQPGSASNLVKSDAEAVDVILMRLNGRLVCSVDSAGAEEHFFYSNGIYVAGTKKVKHDVSAEIKKLGLNISIGKREVKHFSDRTRRLETCVNMIMRHPSIRKSDFHKRLSDSSRRYLAFEDGVYSFDGNRFLSNGELGPGGPLFTQKIERKYPSEDDAAVLEQLMDRVLKPIFPDKEKRDYFLHSVARALAGEVSDKLWFLLMGLRDAGKSLLCTLLLDCFAPFCVTFDTDFLVCMRSSTQGKAKEEHVKWMSNHEFARIMIANEIRSDGKTKVDGSILKRLVSGGDEFKPGRRLQGTLLINCNDFPKVDPLDACENMQVISFDSKFVHAAEMEGMGGSCPQYWVQKDSKIKDWIRQPAVIDTFTSLVLNSYSSERLPTPACVTKDTHALQGPSRSIDVVLSSILYYTGDETSSVSIPDIAKALENEGMYDTKSHVISSAVHRMFHSKTPPPEHKKLSGNRKAKGKREFGFTRVAFVQEMGEQQGCNHGARGGLMGGGGGDMGDQQEGDQDAAGMGLGKRSISQISRDDS